MALICQDKSLIFSRGNERNVELFGGFELYSNYVCKLNPKAPMV